MTVSFTPVTDSAIWDFWFRLPCQPSSHSIPLLNTFRNRCTICVQRYRVSYLEFLFEATFASQQILGFHYSVHSVTGVRLSYTYYRVNNLEYLCRPTSHWCTSLVGDSGSRVALYLFLGSSLGSTRRCHYFFSIWLLGIPWGYLCRPDTSSEKSKLQT